jgi:hypothetical protein
MEETEIIFCPFFAPWKKPASQITQQIHCEAESPRCQEKLKCHSEKAAITHYGASLFVARV